jgi:hypothetical protein
MPPFGAHNPLFTGQSGRVYSKVGDAGNDAIKKQASQASLAGLSQK